MSPRAPHLTWLTVPLGALLCCALMIELSEAEPAQKTVFSRLEEADARRHHASANAATLATRVTEQDRLISSTLDELDLTRRATEKLRRQLVAQHIDWERSLRKSRRLSGAEPGQNDRLIHLLALATPKAMEANREQHHIVSALDKGESLIRSLVGRQGTLIVELAQERASEEAAKEEHAQTLSQARQAKPSEVARDLAATDEELSRELALLLKNPSEKDFHRYKGTLLPPVKGNPDHPYGARKQKNSSSYVRHTGHTYLVPAGTEVRATAAGLVVYTERFEGFGQLLIIDHGAGYHSVYAHLDKFNVKVGARVSKGDVIALSGESGSLEGPKLYFELRKGGEPIDPSAWFLRF